MSTADSRISRPEFRLAIVFCAWTLFGLAQVVIAAAMMNHWTATGIGRSALMFMPRVWVWALVTPLIAQWDIEARKRFTSVTGRITAHVPSYVACAMLQAVVRRTTIVMIGQQPEVPYYVTVLYFADIEAVRYVAALMLGRVLEVSRELVRRERREVALKEEIARAQLHFLDLQLQPHFLFNALGSISELAHEAPQAAARMVEHLTSLLRYATESRSGQYVKLREELAALDPYLHIQRMRFPDWLSIEERIEPAAEEAMIPRMLLQPLVENAIRHGLSHRESGGRIIFGASVLDGDLVISVYDNGAGLQSAGARPGLGIGLGNIRERLATLYGDAQSLELVNHKEGGVEVLLRIPFRRDVPAQIRELVDDTDVDVHEGNEASIEEVSTLRGWLRLTWGWIVAGIFMLLLSLFYVFLRHPETHEPTLLIIRRHVIFDGLWILLTPLVIAAGKAMPISRRTGRYSVPFHVLLGSIVSFAHIAVCRILVSGDQPSLFSGIYMDSLFWNLAAYGVLLGIAHRSAIEGWIKEKDLAAAKMKADLTTARLSTVMLELRPDFLLSSLSSLRTLVTVDVKKAELLLANLADFLRLTMESLTRQTITVERELALLDSYAKVHNSAAGEFPTIQRVVPSSLEAAMVPTGVTRILAERLMEKGDIPENLIVSVRRKDDALTVRVSPGGSGLMPDGLEVDLPYKRGNSHAAKHTAALALQHG
ncbi:MAG TPA: histidine kinase [Gemmatimonadaceae bacterium]